MIEHLDSKLAMLLFGKVVEPLAGGPFAGGSESARTDIEVLQPDSTS